MPASAHGGEAIAAGLSVSCGGPGVCRQLGDRVDAGLASGSGLVALGSDDEYSGKRHRRGNGLLFGTGTWDMAEKVNSPMDGEEGTTKYAKGAKSEAKLQTI